MIILLLGMWSNPPEGHDSVGESNCRLPRFCNRGIGYTPPERLFFVYFLGKSISFSIY